MSDEGDRACPLCAEEMDLTDQQLKPCKCGYEICVWCWHHIMDMAEKDQTQGRCPACRSPYNKEKIVGTAVKCERLVAEMNMEKKIKSQKIKSKTADGRKQLGSVRVIQRNLVYIVGLPLSLADEDLLQHRDYFGQYGKVQKVSISRTAAGSIQQFANNTCSVYITYSKVDEAVRCIQSVHGFVLDSRPLRACFGTTKYCHAWLRNSPCTNPDCLYLHEFGTQEDSFSKDEIVSAYTRNRVQQITVAASTMQRRSGNVLPPPADEWHINSCTLPGKPTSKTSSNNATTNVNDSLPNSSSGHSAILPSAASWGARASNGHPPSCNSACSNGPSKQKPGTYSGSVAVSTFVAAPVLVPALHAELGTKLNDNEESQNNMHKGEQEPLESGSRQYQSTERSTTVHEAPVNLRCLPSAKDKGTNISAAPNKTVAVELAGHSSSPKPNKTLSISGQGNSDDLCSGITSMNITGLPEAECSIYNRSNCSRPGKTAISPVNHALEQSYLEELREPSTLIALGKAVASADDTWVVREQSGLRTSPFTRKQSEGESDLQIPGAKTDSQVAFPEVGLHLQSIGERKLSASEFVPNRSYFSNTSLSFPDSNFSGVHSPTQNERYGSTSVIQDHPSLDDKIDNGLLLRPCISAVLNEYPEDTGNSYVDSDPNFGHSYIKNKFVGRSESEAANAEQSVATDMGESSLISNILSLDFDPWEESLASPQNLVKLLGEADKHQKPLSHSNSWKVQNSNKSRFSFARPDECRGIPCNAESSLSHMEQVFKQNSLSHDFAVNKDYSIDKFGDCNGFSIFNTEEPDNFAGTYSHLSSNKLSGSRSYVSAPPGFSTPNKAPPPGFMSHERVGPNIDAISGSHFSNPYQLSQTGNIGSVPDIEFMDPAILAVGKGRLPVVNNGFNLDMRSNYSPQFNVVENEARYQSLFQRSSPPQNLRFSGTENGFGPVNDTQNIPSRIMEQTLASNLSPFSHLGLQQSRTSMMSNGQWNGWSEGKSVGDMGMQELLRTESLGFNRFYGGYEDAKFRMPTSGDIYNRTFGI